MILVDTSIWIDHLRKGVPRLTMMLDTEDVMMHPFVLGELACGNLKNRVEVLDLFTKLPEAPVATTPEVLVFIENSDLMGRGIGFVDAHLLVSVALTGTAKLWTRDKRLAAVGSDLNLVINP